MIHHHTAQPALGDDSDAFDVLESGGEISIWQRSIEREGYFATVESAIERAEEMAKGFDAAELIRKHAAEIAGDIAASKARAMTYQAADKAFLTSYLQSYDHPEPFTGARRVTFDDLADLPYPVWSGLRTAYYDAAVKWTQSKREGG